MTATKRSACARCGEPHILDGARCVRCRQTSERDYDLTAAARHLARVLVWVELEAMFCAYPHEGRAPIAAALLALRRSP